MCEHTQLAGLELMLEDVDFAASLLLQCLFLIHVFANLHYF